MSRALIAVKSKEVYDKISPALYECGFSQVVSTASAKEARKLSAENPFDLIIVYTPLEDEFGLDLISSLSNGSAGLILITKAEEAEEAQRKIAFTGAFVLARPVSKMMLCQSIRFVMAAQTEILKLRLQNSDLKQKISDLKLIDRAKCVLIQYLRITEAQAHRHIQKQAMDQRISQAEAARDILKIYES